MEFSTLKRVFRGAQRIEPHEDLDSVFTSGSQLGQSHRHDDLIHELQRESFQLKRQLSSVFAQFHLVKEELVVKTQAVRRPINFHRLVSFTASWQPVSSAKWS